MPVFNGTSGNDIINGSTESDIITGLGGDDVITGNGGGDYIDGGDGNDTVSYAWATQFVNVDLLSGYTAGAATGDYLYNVENVIGTSYNDFLTGDAFNNVFEGGLGNDYINGGEGSDTASYVHETSFVNVDLTANYFAGAALGDVLISIENVIGTDYNDFLTGNNGDNILVGGAGDDTISGGQGNDVLVAGGGVNYVDGGAGNDTVSYAGEVGFVNVSLGVNYYGGFALGDVVLNVENVTGTDFGDFLGGNELNNVLSGGKGNDYFTADAGADNIIGGEGIDTINYNGSASAVSIDLTSALAQSGGLAQGDTLSGIEVVIGTNFNDTLIGNSSANQLIAADGTDVIKGNGGGDYIDGGEGTDTVTYAGASSFVNVDLGFGYSAGAALGDAIYNVENLIGTDFNDFLTGGFGTNVIDGGKGDDLISGSYGADVLVGGEGTDTVTYANSFTAVTIDLGSALAQQGGDAQGDTLSGFENVIGSLLNDTLKGDAGVNQLTGNAGDDLLIGGAGADYLDGGDGILDTVSYATSSSAVSVNLATSGPQRGGDAEGDTIFNVENLVGSDFNDVLGGNAGRNILNGGLGTNTFLGSGGGDVFIGGTGSDTVSYANATGFVNVDLAANYAGGFALSDTFTSIENVTGTDFGDFLAGNSGNNVLIGGEGNDYFTGGAGNDTMNGGNGTDTVSYLASLAAVSVDLNSALAQHGGDAEGDLLIAVENVIGTGFNDTLIGNSSANYLIADAGNDFIAGHGGGDYIDGGAGIDTLSYAGTTGFVNVDLASGYAGGAALGDAIFNIENVTGTDFNDYLTGSFGTNILDGGKGDDALAGGVGADVLIGGEGSDTVSYQSSLAGVIIDLNSALAQVGGDAQGDTLSSIENVIGTYLNDTLIGTAASNQLIGSYGDDTLIGGGGADYLDGGLGIRDVSSYAASAAAVTVNLLTNVNTGGDAQGDLLYNIEDVIGSNFNDTLTGDLNANQLSGGQGNDMLTGFGGNDILDGGAGVDTVSYSWALSFVNIDLTSGYAGGAALGDTILNVENITGTFFNDFLKGDTNNNVIVGGLGNDYMTGGAGADVFKYLAATETGSAQGNNDIITDFSQAQGDTLDLSAFAHDYSFIGNSAFTNTGHGQINFSQVGGGTFVGIDSNGDGTLDSQIELAGLHTLTSQDFVL